jgi:hypothetical protein
MIKLIENGKITDQYIDLSNDRSSLSITVKEIVNC